MQLLERAGGFRLFCSESDYLLLLLQVMQCWCYGRGAGKQRYVILCASTVRRNIACREILAYLHDSRYSWGLLGGMVVVVVA